jgi:stage III sporulation protein SpoIIIAA
MGGNPNTKMEQWIDSDLEALVQILPPRVQDSLNGNPDKENLLEIVLDLGRGPEARFPDSTQILDPREVIEDDIQYVASRIGSFGGDNRAGIERTLHRISAVRNRGGKVVGLTLRVGRAVFGTVKIIEDLIMTGKSTLLLGKPGVGKTTMLREVARVLADTAHKRVIIVDTSNEIAGDGDIPHAGIGGARRMQVGTPSLQHAVMIEAVENHMPEVIVIDEISTELEANASRTIAERGVQLVATAHGNTLDNLIRNISLSDLVGGIHTVTLGDIEARRRGTQKTVLERRAPPTFDVLVEIQGWNQVTVHDDVADVVDRMLRSLPVIPENRTLDKDGNVHRTRAAPSVVGFAPGAGMGGRRGFAADARGREAAASPIAAGPVTVTHILPYGVNKGKLQQVVKGAGAPVEVVADIKHADLLLTTKNYYRRRTAALRGAEQAGKPVYVLRKNTVPQIEQFITAISRGNGPSADVLSRAMEEVEGAISRVENGESAVDLSPQGAYVRHLQHQIVERYGLSSSSTGRDPQRRLMIYRP